MKEQFLRNIIRESLLGKLNEQESDAGVFSPAEEKFLAKFVELGATSLGILYTKNSVGIREFLMRSGKDYNLTPDVLSKLMKDGIISIVPYGGYARNQDYTLQCNLPLDELEGLSSAGAGEDSKVDAEGDAVEAGDTITSPAPGDPQESVTSSEDLSKLLVSEQKKHTRTRVHTGKSRALRRLPKGYIVYLERIIQILGQKLHTDLEKQHLVADILDNLAHNFGLTPKQVYKSFIFYNSQNRLKNVIKESLNEQSDDEKDAFVKDKQNIANATLTFKAGYWSVSENNPTVFRGITAVIERIKKIVEANPNVSQLSIQFKGGESLIPNTDQETGTNVKEPGSLARKRGDSIQSYVETELTKFYGDKINVKSLAFTTKIGKTPWDEKSQKAYQEYKKAADANPKAVAPYVIRQMPTEEYRKIMRAIIDEQFIQVSVFISGERIRCNSDSITRSYSRGDAPNFMVQDTLQLQGLTGLTCNPYTVPDRFGIDGKFNAYFSSNDAGGADHFKAWGILLGLMSVAYPNGAFHKGCAVRYFKMPKFDATNFSELSQFLTDTSLNKIGGTGRPASETTAKVLEEVADKLGIASYDINKALIGPSSFGGSINAYTAWSKYSWDKLSPNYIFKQYLAGTYSENIPKGTPAEEAVIKKAWNASYTSKKVTPEMKKLYNWLEKVDAVASLFKVIGSNGLPQLTVKEGDSTLPVQGKTNIEFSCYAPLAGTAFEMTPYCR